MAVDNRLVRLNFNMINIGNRYLNQYSNENSNRTKHILSPIILELFNQIEDWDLKPDLSTIPSKVTFNNPYREKHIRKIFRELGFEVTKCHKIYGKTIVEFTIAASLDS